MKAILKPRMHDNFFWVFFSLGVVGFKAMFYKLPPYGLKTKMITVLSRHG